MKKLLTLLLLSPLAFGEDISEYQRITPIELKIQNNLERTILDYSTSDELGVNQQLAPVGWTGPIVSLEFELRGVVIAGILGLEFKEETAKFNIDRKLLQRDLNDGFSGGEKKRNELIQLLMLQPDLILLDEIDSGLDVDAIKTVANVINSMLDGKKSILMITHYDRLLELIKPDFVHILNDGKIAKTGDYTLALELDEKGYEAIGIKDENK